ncbi:MAG TPA: DsrE family protein [Anaeromyxobacteraceae bacterium]|nr:DsrE family protein [Anaeromyxobacteraceae bacterium]
MAAGRAVVFLSHADAGALRLAASCALTAAAMGDRVDVFLFGPAVRAVVEAALDGDPADDDEAAMLARARAPGCRLIACSAGVVAEKIDLGDAERALDAVVGWPTILEWSRGVVDRFFF